MTFKFLTIFKILGGEFNFYNGKFELNVHPFLLNLFFIKPTSIKFTAKLSTFFYLLTKDDIDGGKLGSIDHDRK